MQKLSKVKATDKLSIPLKLDMASILAMAGAQPLQTGTYQDAQYELMSILIHKGPSASHGHYGIDCFPSLMAPAQMSAAVAHVTVVLVYADVHCIASDNRGFASAHLTQLGAILLLQYALVFCAEHVPCSSSSKTPSGGFAVAHVWDAGAQKWWRCDDEACDRDAQGACGRAGRPWCSP